VRIVAGQWRGRRLKTPGKAEGIRPTSDRLREALFSILAGRFIDGLFIDLFAGTGAVGLEAASRGASQVILIDKGRNSTQLCRANIEALGAQDLVTLRCVPAERPGPLPEASVVFADPPYAEPAQKMLEVLLDIPLAPSGCWCLELAADAETPQPSEGVAALVERVYGSSRLIIYERDT
jgi:16S rRNA (guanine966-N2)-methyltransferase